MIYLTFFFHLNLIKVRFENANLDLLTFKQKVGKIGNVLKYNQMN